MTEVARRRPLALAIPLGTLGVVRDLLIGTLLCMGPVTSVLALGWILRRMGTTIARRRGSEAERPGWVMGPRGRGVWVFALGGLAANIRAGATAAGAIFLLTLPVTLIWLGAWWAGWENSFNKGYEQAGVGPSLWAVATLVALPLLAHLPIALAHVAAENRLSAAFEWRRIRQIAAAARWRLPALAALSVICALPFLGLRMVPVFIEGVVLGFADMTAAEQSQIANTLALIGAALAFAAGAYLRLRAAVHYAAAETRQRPARALAILTVGCACAIWAILPV
ncbi:MAG: hypothetical protein AAF914_07950, partial [Pseudomonadota bacterium]